MAGPVPFALEMAGLVLAFGVYCVIDGNLLESLVAVPAALIIAFAQYRFGRVEARPVPT